MCRDKDLSDMTLEELWQLFPIELVAHRSEWREWAAEEMSLLRTLLSEFGPAVNHIGSTAVEGIIAKPIVDLLIEIPEGSNRRELRNIMERNGYICMAESERRVSFNKGYTKQGYAERVFHIHVRYAGDNDEILFRDRLRAYREIAVEYERLKLGLIERYRHDRDGYTEAKALTHKISAS